MAIHLAPLSVSSTGGGMLEHFVHAFAEVLSVLVRIMESVSLEELRQINFSVFASKRSTTKVPTFVRIDCRGCVAKSTESSPAAPSSEAV